MKAGAVKAGLLPEAARAAAAASNVVSLGVKAIPAAVLLAALAFVYRFNALGGALGGFGNDQFIHLARARQMLGGDLPYRDFLDPGAPLAAAISGAVQWAFGYNLLGEALLVLGALSLGVAITVWLAARVTGRVWPAVVVALLQIAAAPRLYNYPKILVSAAAIWLCWRYVDTPTRSRVAALGLLLTVAFLFRHDFLIYFAALAALTIALANRTAPAVAMRHVAAVAAWALIFVAPYLVFLQLSGGIREYVRQAVAFARADAERTSFRKPVFDTAGVTPIVSLAPVAAAPPPHVNVRWAAALSDQERQRREQQYGLHNGERREGTTWNYLLADASARNLEALVRDPLVVDTHGINRSSFTVDQSAANASQASILSRIQVAPALTRDQNLVAWLYYVMVALPALAAAVWIARVRSAANRDRVEAAAYVWPVIVLTALFAVGFLTRGTLNARLADSAVPAGVLTAWLLSSPLRAVPSMRRRLVRIAGVAVLVVSAWSVAVLGAVRSTALRSKLESPAGMADRTSVVWQTLRQSPAVEALDTAAPLGAAAKYLDRCMPRNTRLFVFGNLPELYFFSNRMFAGGHAWILPGYATSTADQQLTLSRLRAYDVPIVLTEPEPLYGAEYVPDFPLIVEYLRTSYEEVGTLQVGEASRMRVLLAKQARWSVRDAATGLPCDSQLAAPQPRRGEGGL